MFDAGFCARGEQGERYSVGKTGWTRVFALPGLGRDAISVWPFLIFRSRAVAG